MDVKNLPKDIKELLIYDKRPAYLFIDEKKHLPLTEKIRGKEICVYCANPASKDKPCTCTSSKLALEYNEKTDTP